MTTTEEKWIKKVFKIDPRKLTKKEYLLIRSTMAYSCFKYEMAMKHLEKAFFKSSRKYIKEAIKFYKKNK